MNIINSLDEILDSAKGIRSNFHTLETLRRTMKPSDPFRQLGYDWGTILMELEHDFADGLKAVTAIRMEYEKTLTVK